VLAFYFLKRRYIIPYFKFLVACIPIYILYFCPLDLLLSSSHLEKMCKSNSLKQSIIIYFIWYPTCELIML